METTEAPLIVEYYSKTNDPYSRLLDANSFFWPPNTSYYRYVFLLQFSGPPEFSLL